MSDAVIGLDLGTTGIKAVAFPLDDLEGGSFSRPTELAAAVVPTPTHRLDGGGAEYDADELWAAAVSVLRSVTDALTAQGRTPRAVATASMGESGVLLDGGGVPVAPVIAWFDGRTEPQARWWADNIGVERTGRIAGLPLRPIFGATKMLWTRQHRPAAWADGRHWLNMADWATYRLSGEMVTDHSLASRTLLFDLARRQWSDELLAASDIGGALLASLVESGTPVGTVTAEASARTGLPAGAVVGAGGQDHVCAALALGVTEPGMLLDSIGTAEALFLVTDDVDTSGALATDGIGQGAHVAPGRSYAMIGLQEGGGRIDAARIRSGLGWDDFLATDDAGSVIEELAADGQAAIERLLAATGTSTGQVHHLVTGGGSRNAALIERKRRIGGRPVTVAAPSEATALGAALLATAALSPGGRRP